MNREQREMGADAILSVTARGAQQRALPFDIAHDQALDRITRLAARSLAASVALVTIIEDHRHHCRSWYSRYPNGLSDALALCDADLLHDEPLIVLDIAADDRCADDPFVQHAPNLRFYAAVPLETAEGELIGALSIADTQPRATFDADDLATLMDLAALVMDELELSTTTAQRAYAIDRQQHGEAALRESEERLRLALQSAQMGIWDWNVLTDEVIWSEGIAQIFGLSSPTTTISYDRFLACIHPDDRESVSQAIERVRRDGMHRHQEYRVVWPDGTVRWVVDKGKAFHDADGQIVRMLGAILDISERKQAEERLHESENKYRSIVNNLKEVVFHTDPDGFWTFLNPAWTEITGFALPESVGTHCISYVYKEDRPAYEAALQQLIEKRKPYRHEFRCLTKNGGFRWVELHAQLMLAGDKRIAGITGTIADITERKQAEALVVGQKYLLELMTLGAPIADVLESLIKIVEEQAPGMFCSILLLDDDSARLRYVAGPSLPASFTEAIDDLPIGPEIGPCASAAYHGEPVIVPDIAIDPRWTAAREQLLKHHLRACWSIPILSTQGRVLGTFAMYYRTPRTPSAQDIQLTQVATNIAAFAIEPRRVEQALRESEERYRIVAETASDAIMTIDESGTILFVNQATERIFGYTKSELLNQNLLLLIPDHLVASYQRMIQEYIQGQRNHPWRPIEFFGLRKNDTVIPLELSFGEFNKNGKRQFTSIIRDISERKQAEEALNHAYARLQKLSEELRRGRDVLRTLFDGMGDGLVLLDSQGLVLAANQAMTSFLGRPPEQIVGRTWAALCDALAWSPSQVVQQTLHDGRARRRRQSWISPADEHRILDIQTLPLMSCGNTLDQVILHIADVTDRVQVETLVIQNERLAANGKLAATMAHEINTPLQSIRSCLYLAAKAPNGGRNKYLQVAREEIDRIGGILRNLLDLHRPHNGGETMIDLNALIDRVLLLTGSMLAERGIEVARDLAPKLPPLHGRIDQLTQVLLNLTLNAIEAMPRGGQLRFKTREEGRGQGVAPSLVALEIADTGCGMSQEIQQQIFEPFFTTKAQGSGLGLAISHSIVTQHGGQILVQSTPHAGSTFTILFMLDQATTADLEADHGHTGAVG